MMRAVWNGAVLAEAPSTVRLEGNDYFPQESLHLQYFTDSPTKSVCPWKGLARYYTVVVDGATNTNAAWYYPKPSPLARRIKNHVAFWNGVEIEGEPEGSRASLAQRLPSSFGRKTLMSSTAAAGGGHQTEPRALPMWRIGITSGVTGLLCCVGPTVLAILGILSGATALAWADNLYDHYAWWFRVGGLAALMGLTWLALRRRNQCSIDGVRRWRWRLLGTLGIAVGTYLALYALTTWLGTFAS